MNKNNYELNIAHLYPKLLDSYGEWGNVLTLKKRCEWRNINCFVDEININDTIDIQKYDIYFLGSGQESQLSIVAQELDKNKDVFLSARGKNAVFLGICEGYYLLGQSYQTKNNVEIKGLGLLDIYTTVSDKRFTGNVTAKCNYLIPETFVGFENHCTRIYVKNETQPLATISLGNGNNGEDKTEGARFKNVFGSNLHGPILAKNVHFADYLIELALQKKYNNEIKLEKLDDKFEINAHNVLINKSY